MAGLRTDIIKASAVAVIAAILLGGTAYVLNRRIGFQVPVVGTIDAYTTRGGMGPSNSSDFYYSDQEIPIFAQVKDASNNPIEGANLTFRINGPPNSNITIIKTVATNGTGYAVTNVTSPDTLYSPEAVVGAWNVVATTDITGVQITDSLAFEVKAPPSPFIDVYTDRGGVGINKPSESYHLNETVKLYAEVSNGTAPAGSQSVTFTVYTPTGSLSAVGTATSNASGIAVLAYPPRIPDISDSLGTWQIIATVKFQDQVLIDALTFECLPS